jgi:hypothetical protein
VRQWLSFLGQVRRQRATLAVRCRTCGQRLVHRAGAGHREMLAAVQVCVCEAHPPSCVPSQGCFEAEERRCGRRRETRGRLDGRDGEGHSEAVRDAVRGTVRETRWGNINLVRKGYGSNCLHMIQRC